MPNLKFSQFQEQTDPANVQFVVGYNGTDNVRIAPGNLSGYPFLIDTQSLYSGFVPSGLSGNPQGNTVLGISASSSATTGVNNTALGYGALSGNTTGSYNTAVGNNALSVASITSYNTAVGNAAGRLTTGTLNTFLGEQAGEAVTSGQDNVFLGALAGHQNTSTTSNSILIGYNTNTSPVGASNFIVLGNANHTTLQIPGIQSGASNGDVLTYNSTLGKLELQTPSSGGATDLNGLTDCLVDTGSLYVGEVPSGLSGNPQGNTVLGIDAGNGNTNGTENTNIGYQAGYSNATGTNRVCVGYEAGKNGTGNTGVFVGALAGQGSGTNNGTGSVGIGWGALRSYSTGNNNIAIGFQAARSIGGGVTDAVMVGNSAGYSNTANDVTLVGRDASRNNSATGTVSIGYQAGYSNTSGGNNTNIGYKAGYSTTTGASNTTLGYNTLGYHNGNNNVAIGGNAMQGSSSFTGTGADNVAIGYNAGGSVPTAYSNSVLIGKDAVTSPIGASNFIVLGNSSHTTLQIPGIQSGASNGEVLTYNSTTNSLELAAASGGGATDINGLSDCTVTLNTNGDNYFIGTSPGTTGTATYGVTAIGDEAGNAIDLSNSLNSINSTFVGSRAGKAVTSPYQGGVTAIGAYAGSSSTAGSAWTCVGSGAGQTQQHNGTTIIGFQAGWGGTSTEGVIIGKYAQQSGVGSRSISIGRYANRTSSATGGMSIGWDAGFSNTTGLGNTNIGYQAGYSNTTGADRTIIGYEAGEFNTGAACTFLGLGAGKGASGSSTGSYNTAIGKEAGLAITSGVGNTLIGASSGDAINSGNNNVAIGYEAGSTLTAGEQNTFVGYQAGINANPSSGSSGQNTCVGATSGGAITTGIYNTFLGSKSGNAGGGTSATITTGNFNTMLGYEARGNSSSMANSTSLGYQAQSTGSNQVTLGNSSIGTLRCQQTSITSLSDQRDKKDIETIPYGLDFINSLQPKKFVWDNRAETDGDGNEFFSANKGKKDIGFIAQELQTVDDDYLNLVYDANPEKLEATYGRLIPVLVKAIQDLSAKVTALENA